MEISRRSFLRAALIGGSGAATVLVCPELAESLLGRIKYFFIGGKKQDLTVEDINSLTMRHIISCLGDNVFRPSPLFLKARKLGTSTLTRDVTEYRMKYFTDTRIFVPDNSIRIFSGGL